MKTGKTGRGFRVVLEEKYQNEPGVMTRLVGESIAIGEYEDAMDRPGSSFLWVWQDHHLSREQVAELVQLLQFWLANGRLPDGPSKSELEELRKCCVQRGARLQILRELFRDIDWHHACYDRPEMRDWFDERGVPR